ncbi:MAG TPA: hypothetical protein P5217_03615 [Methanoregulaceae archaeon]|nr:hypothetical protein [Methanoregulaceae archaeon]HPD75740.1 hypothetical protein [Methanoregulaceae archaeon]HRY75349.1 hypothetical protein [Methanoregulaceae archaeon]
MARQRKTESRTDPPEERHIGRGRSRDRSRQLDSARHHEESHPLPHPPHKILARPTGLPKHHPHTRPPEEALDIDHGTHEDRPRPGKLMKKETIRKKP